MCNDGEGSYDNEGTRRYPLVVVAEAAAKKGKDLAQQGLDC